MFLDSFYFSRIFSGNFVIISQFTLSQRGLLYPPPRRKISLKMGCPGYDIKLYFFGDSSGDLESEEKPFIAITPRSTQTVRSYL